MYALRAARVPRHTTTADLGLPEHEPKSIYINERLIKRTSILFAKARMAGNAAGWKFVWTRQGLIYARQRYSLDCRAHRLHSEADLERVFNISSVGTRDLLELEKKRSLEFRI